MDPRLNPNLTPQPHPVVPMTKPLPQPLHLPTQPASAQQSPVPAPAAPSVTQPAIQARPSVQPETPMANPIDQPMVTQVVASFPVKQQDAAPAQPQAATPGMSGPIQNTPNPSLKPEDDLDKILEAVNNRVKAPEKPTNPKKKKLAKTLFGRTARLKDKTGKTKNPKPIGAMIVVLMVALMLSATAILAYREGGHTAATTAGAGKVGTSYTASSAIQEAGGSLVNPADLDDYAQTLQTKLNSLNDSQDFTTSSLSDQVLGL